MPHYKRNKDGSRKTGRKSSTPGVKKGKSCQTTPEIRIICSRNRSYKQKNY